jgi:hypothetical protein
VIDEQWFETQFTQNIRNLLGSARIAVVDNGLLDGEGSGCGFIQIHLYASRYRAEFFVCLACILCRATNGSIRATLNAACA